MKYSIIIPVWNKEELTKKCIESIEKYTTDYEIIVVDNGSKKPFYSPYLVIRNETNFGFPVACNQGIKEAKGDIIVLLNNDTIVTPNWLDHLSEHLINYDLVGPLTNSISGVQQLTLGDIQIPEGLNKASELVYKNSQGHAMPYHRLVFYCVAIKKEVFEKIGLLDEQFSPGNCEDDDFCLRAIEAGYKLAIANDVLIYHSGSATFDKNNIAYAELLQKNSQKLMTKWPEKKYQEMVLLNKKNCEIIEKLPRKTLALVMVVKNEAVGLERAILSCKDFVDQIVLAVDESSNDGTYEIAKKYATTLKTFKWRDDFAWARNFAHENIISDYFLFLDGHEYVIKHDNLEVMLNLPSDGLLCTVRMDNGADIRNPRIYRSGLQFSGAVHEIQNCKMVALYSDFIVQHGRVGGQSDEAIFERDVQRSDQLERIMGEAVKKNPADIRSSFHLALHKQGNGDYKSALKMQKIYFKYGKMKGERWYMFLNKALCHLALGNPIRALWACSDAEKECPSRWEIAKVRGQIHFVSANYSKAIKYLVDSFADNVGDESYKPIVPDFPYVWNMIGECYFNLEMFDLAKKAFEQAFKLEKDGNKKKLYYDRAKIMKELY